MVVKLAVGVSENDDALIIGLIAGNLFNAWVFSLFGLLIEYDCVFLGFFLVLKCQIEIAFAVISFKVSKRRMIIPDNEWVGKCVRS